MLSHDADLEEYLISHTDAEPDALQRLYRDTHIRHLYPRMCSGHYQGRLLKMLTAMIRPERVLEIGTYTGYSALAIAEALTGQATVDTIEIDDEKEPELRHTFATAPGGDRVNLIVGDAVRVIPTLAGPYQLVFIDGNKRQYLQYLELVLPLVPVGGFIMADNTLWDMKVVSDCERHDAQTDAIAEFNDALTLDRRLEKIILPVRDGLTLMRRVV